ncbi:hypothetical protein M422DRAFT_250149 [Sphaerobolus stellatus SS14]|nr:hypothetical protein M422DRAFT_250149 [Sphaerobolus stellatus SS14]
MEHDNESNLANAPYAFYPPSEEYHLSYPQPQMSPYPAVVSNASTPDTMLQMRNLTLLTHGGNFSYPGSPTRLASNTHLPPSPSPVDTGSVYDHPISPPVSGSDTSTDGSTYHTPHTSHSYSRESSSPPSIRRSHQHRYNPTAGHRRRRSSTNDEGDFSDDEHAGSTGSMLPGQALAEQLSNTRKEATRKQRIEAEQRRRDELREGYARLKNVLPLTNQKSSKVSLLERATNHIVQVDNQNKILTARVNSLEAQLSRLRETAHRLGLMIGSQTGHMPEIDLEYGPGPGPSGPHQGYEEQHQPPLDARPLSPPPDVQPVTPQPMSQHAGAHPMVHPLPHAHQEPGPVEQQQHQRQLAHQQQQQQQQLHQPHPHPHMHPHAAQMYQHRNDSSASASGSEYSLN